MEPTSEKCTECRFPIRMCQCKTYGAIKARQEEKRRETALQAELRRTANQNSHNGNIYILKETYQELIKKGKEDRGWKRQLYQSSLRDQLRK